MHSAKLCRRPEIRQVQFLDRFGHARRCATTGWMVQTVQKTVEVPQLQLGVVHSLDKVVDTPAGVQRQARGPDCEKSIQIPQFFSRCSFFQQVHFLSGVIRAGFSALDHQEFSVIEGSGEWR